MTGFIPSRHRHSGSATGGTPTHRASTYVACNGCGKDVTRDVHHIARLVKCVSCGLIYVNPRYSAEALLDRYNDAYFNCSEPTSGGYEDYEADREDIQRTFRARMKLLRPWVRAGKPRLLDVGCATGLFLEVASKAGWDVGGLDISDYALSLARRRGLQVRNGTLPDPSIPSGSYDVITLWDVIEHVPDPTAIVAECRRLLRPGGVLAMSTPDAGSVPARILRGKWLGFRCIDEHVYFFSRKTMAAMLEHGRLRPARFHDVGKCLSLSRLVERMRFYSRIAASVLRTVDRLVPKLSIHVNPHDTMCVIALRTDGT